MIHNKEWGGQGAKVLVVDDEAINVEVVKSIVQDTYALSIASSGEDALDQAQRFAPDAILLDVVLGDMTGIDVCRTLKRNPLTQSIPVLFLTSLESHTNEQMCWDAGGVDFILKPVNPDTLLNRLRVHLTLRFQSQYLQKLAYIDGLTGLYNRRYFDEQMQRHWEQAQRNMSDISVLMIDVDYFKRFNDSMGHLAGDDCLKSIAHSLDEAIQRPLDIACRYGGEEFAIILPDSDLTGASEVARRVQDCIEREPIVHPKSPWQRVTVSIGITTSTMPSQATYQQLLQVADQHLYCAKEQGRNKVCHFDKITTSTPTPSLPKD
ncbi:diguanylate cyclase [Gilvimarinus agarilyticus]|uniref:GGDEF domain-containing response regulator n=1 Tax=unclassified Gilvimarinus TaxID=2642066 RepID=UPI001C0946A5|nr:MULTISPECIES: diguanylate cyclase [unclassified Gilvimarinus]MBU2885272.1 diguanylate cyclase [Gilvimarinus agarilyticus]MDO6570169.1 diguanylate cyclase [Gilvimarinus sp. 2_MG-2023]MDO6748336.1 diguanylate cyclase [Gilvimarinus sp. 1_MG-2023]